MDWLLKKPIHIKWGPLDSFWEAYEKLTPKVLSILGDQYLQHGTHKKLFAALINKLQSWN